MSEYYFQGRNSNGLAVEGRRYGLSRDQIASQLINEGIIPISIQPYHAKRSLFTALQDMGQRITAAETMLFCRQMYTLIKAGIPLVTALQRLIEMTRHASLKKALRHVVERISAGETLSVALQKFPKIFPSLFTNIIQVGEKSGNLEQSFLQLGNYYQLEEKTFKQIKTVLRYPLITLTTLLAALLLIHTMVIPAFAHLFERFQTALPLPTRMLIAISDFLLHHWNILLLATVMLMGLLIHYVRTPAGTRQWHTLQRQLPIVGPILRRLHLARFGRIFAITFRAGVSLSEGLYLTSYAIGNEVMKQSIQGMRRDIERGGTLTQAAINARIFSPLTLQLISVGEETGYLSEMLDELAEFYEREIDYDISRLTDSLEPLLLGGIAVVILILALGVFLPMWNLPQLIFTVQ